MIEFKGFSFAYENKNVLTDVSAHFLSGDFCAIMGPNGAGKSTLLKAVCRILPQVDNVFVDGRAVKDYSFRDLSRKVAYVPQKQEVAFDIPVRDAVMMGRNPYRKLWQGVSENDAKIVQEAMRKTRLDDLSDRMLSQLSGGEFQRVLIARAIAQQTPIMLLDEPLSNLDVAHQLEILDIVANLNQQSNTTVLMVLHDFSQALHWTKDVLLLHEGRIVAHGPSSRILTPSRLKTVFEVPEGYDFDADGHIRF